MLSTEQTAVNAACLAACAAAGLEADIVQGAILSSIATGRLVTVTMPQPLLYGVACELYNRFHGEGILVCTWRDPEGYWSDTHYTESTGALITFSGWGSWREGADHWSIQVYGK